MTTQIYFHDLPAWVNVERMKEELDTPQKCATWAFVAEVGGLLMLGEREAQVVLERLCEAIREVHAEGEQWSCGGGMNIKDYGRNLPEFFFWYEHPKQGGRAKNFANLIEVLASTTLVLHCLSAAAKRLGETEEGERVRRLIEYINRYMDSRIMGVSPMKDEHSWLHGSVGHTKRTHMEEGARYFSEKPIRWTRDESLLRIMRALPKESFWWCELLPFFVLKEAKK